MFSDIMHSELFPVLVAIIFLSAIAAVIKLLFFEKKLELTEEDLQLGSLKPSARFLQSSPTFEPRISPAGLIVATGFASNLSDMSDSLISSSSIESGITGSNFDSGSGFMTINPASGLPMIGDGIGGFDVGGNVFGSSSMTDFHSSSSAFDSHNSFGSGIDI